MKKELQRDGLRRMFLASNKDQSLGLPRQWKVIASTIILLFTMGIGQMWGTQTELISGVTLPDVPSASLDMASQSTFTPDANGWIVFNPYASSSSLGNWWKANSSGSVSQTFATTDLTSSTAPFFAISSGSIYALQSTTKTYAIRFKGAESASFLIHGRQNGDAKALVSLYSYIENVQTLIETKETGKAWYEALFSGLNTSTEYIAYIYENTNSNGGFGEVALKKPVSTTPAAPAITNPASDPDLQTITQGETKTFTVTATGYPAPTYKWYRNSSKSTTGAEEIEGATAASYTTPNTLAASASNYYFYCVATNASGSAQSPYFSLKVNELGEGLTTHTPGVYTKTTSEGGWGQTLVKFTESEEEREYEIIAMAGADSKNFWWAGTRSVTTSDPHCLSTEGFTTEFAETKVAGEWMRGSLTARGSSYSTALGEFAAVSYYSSKINTSDKSVTIKVQGYDQISFLAKDNNATASNNKHFVVKVNGIEQSMTLNTNYSVRRFTLDASKVSVVEISGCSVSGDNHLVGFSLRIPTCEEVEAPEDLSCTAQTVNTLTFGWSAVDHVSGYIVKLWDNAGCTGDPVATDANVTATSKTFTGLSNSSTYYCKVQSKGDGTTYCAEGGVTSAAQGTTATPSCGVVTPPTFLQAGSITAEGATLLVTDAADAMNYEFYISEESTEPETSATATHTSTTKEKAVTGLTSGKTYYVWVRSVCDADHKSIWVALDGDKFKVKAEPTTTFANGIYVLGGSALDLSALIANNNSAGAITYEITDAGTTSASISTAAFSATAMGTATVQATQAAYGDFAEKVMSATITVLDDELSDTYIWSKASKYGGDGKCISGSAANVDPNANAALTSLNYSSLTMENATSMGRPGDNKVVTLTFTATQEGFAIKDICTFGKLEEALGGQIRWDDGEWTTLAKYGSGDGEKKTFSAPAGTFPTTFSIRFTSASSSEGGLWWRNALVTLEVKKTVTGVTEALVGAEINGAAISSENLATLLEDKTLDIATAYAAAPTVTFKKQVTTSYAGGWPADVEDVDVEVAASDITTAWQASQTIGGQAYTITLAKPTEPSLETLATSFTLTSTKIATDTKEFTFSGANLEHSVAIALESDVEGLSVSPAVVIPTEKAITNQKVTITYKSLENVAEANVNLIVSYSESVKLTIPLTYSSTVGYEDLTSISAGATWNWDGAADAAVGTVIDKDQMIILANADATWDENFNARAIAGKLEYMYRDGKYAQGLGLKFNTTVAGKVYVKFSNTSTKTVARAPRITDTNGSYAPTDEADGAKTADAKSYSHAVAAGDVLIEGFEMQEGTPANMLRYYEVKFLPTHTLSFAEAGSVEPMTVAETEKAVLPEPATVPSGKSFIGWYIEDTKIGDAGDEYTMGTANVELTAKFSAPAETPVINAQPTGSAYCAGSEPTLTVGVNAVSDGGTLHYAWYKKGETDTQVGSDAASYTVESAGTYYVIVTNQKAGSADASVTSENAVVTMNTGAEITAQPTAMQVVDAGDAVELSVTATNATGYQWYKDGVLITGAEAATYNFTAAVGAATYYCVVTGACGNVQSNNAVVYVESGDCNTAGYGDGADNVFGTKGSEIALGSYVTYKYSKSPSDYNILVGETPTAVKSHKMDGEFYVWTANTELAAITTSVLTDGTTGGKYCVVFYDVAGYQPDASHIISVVELTAGLKNAAQTFDVTPAPADAKCARLVRKVVWNETTYGEDSQTYIYAFRACAIIPAETPVILADPGDINVCEFGAVSMAVTIDDITDGGTISYQWYKVVAGEDDEAVGTNSASYTPTAEGEYYVVITNTKAGCPSSSVTSEHATATLKTSTAITAYVNAAGALNAEKTISVTAVGDGTITYSWFTCDNEAGENPVPFDPANDAASYNVTITADPQYYLVSVHSECGDDQTQVLYAKEWTDVELQDVTGSMTWNFATSNVGLAADVEATSTMVLANAGQGAMPNNANFRSDMLVAIVAGTQTKVRATENEGCYQGTGIKFRTTVPGIVTVKYRGTGNTADVTLTIGSETLPTYHGDWTVSKKVFVPVGELEITSVGTMRIKEIVFNATPDYTREVDPQYYGTICLPKAGVMVGARLFEVSYMNYQEDGVTPYKIFYDEIPSGVMEAGMPYIFLAENDKIGVFYTADDAATAQDYKGLHGTLVDITSGLDAENIYLIYRNQVLHSTSPNSSLKMNRAYIQMNEVPGYGNPNYPAPALAPGRRRINMGVQGEQTATGFDNLVGGETPQKIMIDGTIYILRGEKLYDATGRLVK